jgi:hypothetical protein
MVVKENQKEYMCHYGHRFIGNQVKLLPFKNDSRELIGCVTFIKSEDGKWFKGGRPPEGYLMACPHLGLYSLEDLYAQVMLLLTHKRLKNQTETLHYLYNLLRSYATSLLLGIGVDVVWHLAVAN